MNDRDFDNFINGICRKEPAYCLIITDNGFIYGSGRLKRTGGEVWLNGTTASTRILIENLRVISSINIDIYKLLSREWHPTLIGIIGTINEDDFDFKLIDIEIKYHEYNNVVNIGYNGNMLTTLTLNEENLYSCKVDRKVLTSLSQSSYVKPIGKILISLSKKRVENEMNKIKNKIIGGDGNE